MMADPAIILLDEPAGGVNATLIQVIIDRIRDINESGITILLIEHNIDMVTRLCHRVLLMASGELSCEGTADEVGARPACHRDLSFLVGGGLAREGNSAGQRSLCAHKTPELKPHLAEGR
jgi:ABC-type branched-subunit amino acid transport system ATPase component